MNSSIELIRLFAVVLIVFTHTRHELDSGTTLFIIERLPTFGTAILSVVSGYLYFNVSRQSKNLFFRKIKSLAIPYLIANVSVLVLVLIFNYVLGYNALNRLSFDLSLISEGIFALNSAPINPPTYFIRDIFLIFSVIALFTQREVKSLFVIIPFVVFGTLILRSDVAILFVIGSLYAKFKDVIDKRLLIGSALAVSVVFAVFFPEYLKFPSSFLLFIVLIDLPIKLYKTGRYSYLLHLYHSPIIVITYPFLSLYIGHPIWVIVAQIILALSSTYILFLVTKKFAPLKILSGGR
jgi:hypothetical protein